MDKNTTNMENPNTENENITYLYYDSSDPELGWNFAVLIIVIFILLYVIYLGIGRKCDNMNISNMIDTIDANSIINSIRI